jgi:hypothetical protein
LKLTEDFHEHKVKVCEQLVVFAVRATKPIKDDKHKFTAFI